MVSLGNLANCCTYCYFQRAKVRMMRKLTKHGVDFFSEERGVACGTGGSWDVADVGDSWIRVLFCFTQRRKVFIINVITGITQVFRVILVIRGDI